MAKSGGLILVAVGSWSVAYADPPASGAVADCDHAAANVMAIGKVNLDTLPGVTPQMRLKIKQRMAAQCTADQWSADSVKCFVYAKDLDDLARCADKLTQDQRDKLDVTMLAATGSDQIVGAATGDGTWQGVVGASPWETDPVNLCGPIDPPMASRRASASDEKVYECYKALEKQAFEAQSRAAARKQLAAQSDAAVDRCFAAMSSTPYSFTSFEPAKACAAYDSYLIADTTALKSGQYEGPAGERLRSDVARNTKQKSDCLDHANAAMAAGRKARAAAAPSVSLVTLRDIPPSERIAEETARIASDIAACKTEAARRREERQKLAATRDLNELRAIEPQYRLPDEQARVAEDDARRAAVLEKRQRDPKWMGPLLSATICVAASKKAAAAKEIQTEYAYAKKYGGMIDKAKIYDLQQQIRGIDEAIAETRAAMQQLKASVQSCQVKLIRQLTGCISPDAPSDDAVCQGKQIREYLELVVPAD